MWTGQKQGAQCSEIAEYANEIHIWWLRPNFERHDEQYRASSSKVDALTKPFVDLVPWLISRYYRVHLG